ncbi:amidase [soil metagenome]
MFELHHLSAQEQWDWLQRGEVTATELTSHYLSRIERLNPSLGALVTVTADAALARAASLTQPGTEPLWGLPFADKDLTARAGVRSSYGSRRFEHFVPETSDEIALALDRAGAISLGKTNTPEFGMTAYTESLVAPPALNPWDLGTNAGGSSGGAAAAVAAGLLPFAPASDGGGSIRIPAAVTGLVGLKTSRGLLPVGGGVDRFAGLPVAGAIARTVADAAMLVDALIASGPAPFALRSPPSHDPLLASAVRGEGRFQLGVLWSSPWDQTHEIRLDSGIRSAVELAIAEFQALGHGSDEVQWVPSGYAELFTTLWKAGASTLPVEGEELELLEPITAWLVRAGRALGAQEVLTALAAASAFERATIASFAPFDAVITPTLAQTARPNGWFDDVDAEENFAQQVRFAPYTSFVNVAGLPAITLPVGVDSMGKPAGVQLIGRPGGEAVLLSLGAQLERRLGWQRRHPPIWTD